MMTSMRVVEVEGVLIGAFSWRRAALKAAALFSGMVARIETSPLSSAPGMPAPPAAEAAARISEGWALPSEAERMICSLAREGAGRFFSAECCNASVKLFMEGRGVCFGGGVSWAGGAGWWQAVRIAAKHAASTTAIAAGRRFRDL